MQKEYLDRLGDKPRDLCLEIEAITKTPINVKVRADKSNAGKKHLSCNIESSGADILIFSPDYFPDSSVFHELLHIQRILVKKIPRLAYNQLLEGWDPLIEKALTHQDNAYEHLLIIPEEISAYPERAGYWESIVAREWAAITSLDSLSSDEYQFILANWILLNHALPRGNTLALAESVIKKHGLIKKANELLNGITPLLNDKRQAMLLWFDSLGNSKDFAALEYIDIVNNKSHQVPIIKIEINSS